MKKVYYIKIPIKLIHVYRVVATSKAEALLLMQTKGEQVSSENQTDTGPPQVIESNEPLSEWD